MPHDSEINSPVFLDAFIGLKGPMRDATSAVAGLEALAAVTAGRVPSIDTDGGRHEDEVALPAFTPFRSRLVPQKDCALGPERRAETIARLRARISEMEGRS